MQKKKSLLLRKEVARSKKGTFSKYIYIFIFFLPLRFEYRKSHLPCPKNAL